MKGRRWRREEAWGVAQEVMKVLRHGCVWMTVAGSVRRGKAEVGDVEIVYVPEVRMWGLFGDVAQDMADGCITDMLKAGVLAMRRNKNGGTAWGAKNKLAVHLASGIPVDLFATTQESKWNYLVCRTGPAESNLEIAKRARGMGWKWNPYGAGFTNLATGAVRAMDSERAVFAFVGMPFLPAEERGVA